MSRDLLLASRVSPHVLGGLAAVMRGLAVELQAKEGVRVVFCSEETEGPAALSSELLPLRGRSPTPRALWMHLASRPLFHRLLVALIQRHYAWNAPTDFQPQVVHFVGTGWDFCGFAVARMARKWGARFTVFPAVHPGAWGDDRIDLRLYRMADRVVCQSRNEQAHLECLGLPSGRSVVAGQPPFCQSSGEGSRLRARLEIGDRPAVLFLGRREPSKGFEALLEAWPSVVKAIPHAVLLIAGPPASDNPAMPNSDSIHDLGAVDESTKADALAACDLLCLPSDGESFGIVYVEAWSYGKPVVCGTAPATREWVRDGENGLWTDGSSEDVARALIRLLGDPPLRQRLGGAGHDLQVRELNWEKVLRVYRSVWFDQ